MFFRRVTSGILHRSRTAIAQLDLNVKGKISGYPVWFDNGPMKLPYHGDGDKQELLYRTDGRSWWDHEVKMIAPYMKEGDVAIDVGANQGFMSGVLSYLSGRSGHVYSFEPNPKVFAKLLEVIEANHLDTVSAYNSGCGKDEQSMTLYCPPSSGFASLRPNTEIDRSTLQESQIQILNLDLFLASKLDRLNFIKIDTEGYEDDVLLGAIELLRRFQPVVYIELCSEYLSSSERAIKILRDLGYSFDRDIDLRHSSNGNNYFAIPKTNIGH